MLQWYKVTKVLINNDTKVQRYKGTKVQKCNTALYNDLMLHNCVAILNGMAQINGIALLYGTAWRLTTAQHFFIVQHST